MGTVKIENDQWRTRVEEVTASRDTRPRTIRVRATDPTAEARFQGLMRFMTTTIAAVATRATKSAPSSPSTRLPRYSSPATMSGQLMHVRVANGKNRLTKTANSDARQAKD